MPGIDETVRLELVAMAATDRRVRQALVADGSLAREGYHPRMERVHRANAERLAALIDRYGWPGRGRVGDDGAEAAWQIVQHAIGDPPFMRRCLVLLRQAAADGEVPAWQPALLEDRIRVFEGRPQRFGSQFRPDRDGNPVPFPIEAPERVDARRRAVGLDTLTERIDVLRMQARRERLQQPEDWEERHVAWLRSAGWRD